MELLLHKLLAESEMSVILILSPERLKYRHVFSEILETRGILCHSVFQWDAEYLKNFLMGDKHKLEPLLGFFILSTQVCLVKLFFLT